MKLGGLWPRVSRKVKGKRVKPKKHLNNRRSTWLLFRRGLFGKECVNLYPIGSPEFSKARLLYTKPPILLSIHLRSVEEFQLRQLNWTASQRQDAAAHLNWLVFRHASNPIGRLLGRSPWIRQAFCCEFWNKRLLGLTVLKANNARPQLHSPDWWQQEVHC